jgi:small GTP-binding protein
MTQKNNDYKIILIGDSAVGKTSIFKKLTTGTFVDKNISTIGMDKRTLNFKDIEVEINGKKKMEEFNIVLYDTAGQERYRSITRNYFRGSDIVFVIYDITNRKSFEDVEVWLESLCQILSNWKTEKYIVSLLGNKIDFVENDEKPREVEEEEAQKLCENNDILWSGECSVKNFSVEELNEVFIKSWREFVKKFGIKSEISSQNRIEGSKYVKKKKKGGFC